MGSATHSSKRKKKQSQTRSKKRIKSSKEKTKRVKRRHDSVSCSDSDNDGDRVSDLSVSCSSSEDDCMSRKDRRGRTKDRKGRRDGKKRVKRSSSLSESSEDGSPRVKKRRRSKSRKGSESRKKRRGKKRRREPSVSSSSGRSRSCSPCDRSDDSEREVLRKEGKARKGRDRVKERGGSKRSRRRLRSCSPGHRSDDSESEVSVKVVKERKGREKAKDRSGSKRRKRRSTSCSSGSLHSEDHNSGSAERVMEESNPKSKRLKSVVVAMQERDEGELRESNLDGNKEEIVYEHDDYPSRSNDSHDGVNRREVLLYSHDVNSEKPRTLNDSNREAARTDVMVSESGGRERVIMEETGGVISSNVNVTADDQLKVNSSEVSTGISAIANEKCDDLAAILRQKALQNLLRRQGKLPVKTPADKKDEQYSEVKSTSHLNADPACHIPDEQRGIKPAREVVKVDNVTPITDVPGPPIGNDARPSSGELEAGHASVSYKAHADSVIRRPKSAQEMVKVATDVTSPPKGDDARLPSRVLGTGGRAETYKAQNDFVTSRPKLGILSSGNEITRGRNTWRRQVVSQASSQPHVSSSKELVNHDSKPPLISQVSFQPDVSANKEASDIDLIKGTVPASLETKVGIEKVDSVTALESSATGVQRSSEKTTESNEDSQFQQKTMAVMRGGEMVEVSYKVYIPKKAPALARRRLKR